MGNNMTEEEYMDRLFEDIDPNIKLDEEQREVIRCDDDYLMVIAGAGAGKTTTMAAKVKYLVERKGIDPKQIVMISLTNKAVDELKYKINDLFGLPILISTFHRFAMTVLRECGVKRRICLNSLSIMRLFLKQRLSDGEFRKEFIKFFSCYWPDNRMSTWGSDVRDGIRKRVEYVTLLGRIGTTNEEVARQLGERRESLVGEYMGSVEEVIVANYLFLHNIIYEYQKPYPNCFSYLPDFTLTIDEKTYYIDLFTDRPTGKKLFKFQYLKRKIERLHETYHTEYIVLNGAGDLLEELQKQLEIHGIKNVIKSEKEIYFILKEIQKDREFDRFLELCVSFIHSFKMNGYTQEQFVIWKNECFDKRNTFFLTLLEEMYQFYIDYMEVNDFIDFDDMINLASNLIKERNIALPYQYIIVDEYQDISKERFLLLKEVVKKCHAKLIVVGDDWQCIFSFAGSELPLFMNFQEEMGRGKQLQITHTYRNSQALIDIAGNFIMKNEKQYKKSLLSPKQNAYPIRIYLYDENKDCAKSKVDVIERCIIDIVEEDNDVHEILLIGRYKKDIDILIDTKRFYIQNGIIKNDTFPQIYFTFLTAHASKGLGFEHVIILNGESGEYGFPSEKINDPILNYVLHNDNSYEDAEERRLFYVALTRTKNTVSIIAPINSSSKFLMELDSVRIINCTSKKWESKSLRCPKCHFALERKYWNTKEIHPLYCCTNNPRVCGFETNNLNFMKKITVCPKCNRGYIVVKKSNHGYFIGCTNYKNGCNYFKKL